MAVWVSAVTELAERSIDRLYIGHVFVRRAHP